MKANPLLTLAAFLLFATLCCTASGADAAPPAPAANAYLAQLPALEQKAAALFAAGKYADAEKQHRAVLAVRERFLGATHPDTLTSRFHVAEVLFAEGRFAASEKENAVVLAERTRALGAEHPDTLASRDLSGRLVFTQRDGGPNGALGAPPPGTGAAGNPLADVASIRERVLGPDHMDTCRTQLALAETLLNNDSAKVITICQRIVPLFAKALGPEHHDTLTAREILARAKANLSSKDPKKGTEAATELGEVLAIRQRKLGPEHPDTLISRLDQAEFLSRHDKFRESEVKYRALLPSLVRVLGEENPIVWQTHRSLAEVLNYLEKHQDAVHVSKAVVEIQTRQLGPEHPKTIISRERFALFLSGSGNHAQAEREYRAILAIKQRTLGPMTLAQSAPTKALPKN